MSMNATEVPTDRSFDLLNKIIYSFIQHQSKGKLTIFVEPISELGNLMIIVESSIVEKQ